MSRGRKVRREGLGDPLEMGAERKRSLQWVVYYRAGGETGIRSGGAEKEVKVCSQAICFPGWNGLWKTPC